MMRFLWSILLNGLLVFLAARLIGEVSVVDFESALIAGIALGLVNFLIKPILKILTLPITILTLGLFLLVINGLMVLLVDRLVDGFQVGGLLPAIIFSVVLAVLNTIANMLGLGGKKD